MLRNKNEYEPTRERDIKKKEWKKRGRQRGTGTERKRE